jgi:hypothetical protein
MATIAQNLKRFEGCVWWEPILVTGPLGQMNPSRRDHWESRKPRLQYLLGKGETDGPCRWKG